MLRALQANNKISILAATKLLVMKSENNNVKTSLSQRESEIASLLARGFSEKEIADKLCISPATVNNHTRNIRENFHC